MRPLLLLVVLFGSCSADVVGTLSHCCNHGLALAQSSKPCDVHSSPITGIPRQQQSICQTTSSVCCLRQHRLLMCQAGVLAARRSQLCVVIQGINVTGSEYYKDCCDACKLGIAVRDHQDIGRCDLKTFDLGYPWNHAFVECCHSVTPTNTNFLIPISVATGGATNTAAATNTASVTSAPLAPVQQQPTAPVRHQPAANNQSVVNTTTPGSVDNVDECSRYPVGHLCSHLCVDTPQGYHCDCYAGYTLHSDGQTCVPASDRCATNNPCQQLCTDTGDSVVCSCNIGFELQRDDRTCEDIDECQFEEDECDVANEYCVNTVGSYDCVGRQTSGQQNTNRGGIGHDAGRESARDISRSPHQNVSTSPYIVPTGCPHGYEFNPLNSACKDIDECALGMDNCDRVTQFCSNTVGTFSCFDKQTITTCPPGYKYNSLTSACIDVNECAEGIAKCNPEREFCLNLQGTYECQPRSQSSCPAGFKLNTALKTCEDVNECQVGSHSCLASQRCDNTVGSFTCIRLTGCGTGYTLNAHLGKCEDDDECELGNHNCGTTYQCHNTLGSFRCLLKTCPYGYRLIRNGTCIPTECAVGTRPNAEGNCADINECETANICRANQQCINTQGSYRCQNLVNCGAGYELDTSGTRCQDIDECTLGTHECTGGQQCTNRPGSYVCQCPLGHTRNAQGVCEDIDECTRYGKVCAHNSECQNSPGSYSCLCKDGFAHGDNDKTCIDVDECKQFENVCQHSCINTWGSYQCTCLPGYTQGDDKRACTDIDECALYKGRGNLCIGFCVNEPGSFTCSCPPGYKLSADKHTCQDIDECAQGNVCNGENELCLNTKGSYKCNQIQCPPSYVRDPTHKNRCKRESTICLVNDDKCIKQPLSYSYNYLTFVSNLPIPPTGHVNLFTLRGPHFQDIAAEFSLDLSQVRTPQGIQSTTREFFNLKRTSTNQAVVSLVRSIPGPQEIELGLSMNLYKGSTFGGSAVAKIYIYVSEYEF